ncbi:MAG: hypothetical protein GY874_07765 [Desulfobacteraceae bacterium]|nr:hypothetical protein [Desulfobacteraceae bacterium]
MQPAKIAVSNPVNNYNANQTITSRKNISKLTFTTDEVSPKTLSAQTQSPPSNKELQNLQEFKLYNDLPEDLQNKILYLATTIRPGSRSVPRHEQANSLSLLALRHVNRSFKTKVDVELAARHDQLTGKKIGTTKPETMSTGIRQRAVRNAITEMIYNNTDNVDMDIHNQLDKKQNIGLTQAAQCLFKRMASSPFKALYKGLAGACDFVIYGPIETGNLPESLKSELKYSPFLSPPATSIGKAVKSLPGRIFIGAPLLLTKTAVCTAIAPISELESAAIDGLTYMIDLDIAIMLGKYDFRLVKQNCLEGLDKMGQKPDKQLIRFTEHTCWGRTINRFSNLARQSPICNGYTNLHPVSENEEKLNRVLKDNNNND